MSLLTHGDSTLAVKITHVSSHGVWLLSNDKELFMSYEDFPWFKEQPPGHFYWPNIDVDLTIELIEHPERFPLKSEK